MRNRNLVHILCTDKKLLRRLFAFELNRRLLFGISSHLSWRRTIGAWVECRMHHFGSLDWRHTSKKSRLSLIEVHLGLHFFIVKLVKVLIEDIHLLLLLSCMTYWSAESRQLPRLHSPLEPTHHRPRLHPVGWLR